MAGKIPVGRTIVRSYGFAFGNIVNNFGAIWIPVAILYALAFYYRAPYAAAAARLASGDPAEMMATMPILLAACAIAFVLIAVQFAAITKEALGLRTGNAFIQFPFGAAAWRLIGAYLLYFIVLVVIYVLVLLLNLAVGLALRALPLQAGIRPLAALAVALIILCAFFYASIRLSFFLAPVAVAERRVSLIRAWELAKGNFWRIFAVILALLVPILIAECIYIYSIYGTSLFPPLHATPEQLEAFRHHQQEISLRAMETTQRYWYAAYPANLLVSLVFYGLFSGGAAFAYRALENEAEPQPVPGES